MVRFASLGGCCALCVCLLAFTSASDSWSLHGQPPDPLANCWQDLAADDAAQAYRATWLLAQHPAEAVKMLHQHLNPVAAPDKAQIQTWLAELESEKYAVRVKALQELEKQGELAEPQLRKVLESNPQLETRQRVQKLLDRLQGPLDSPEKLRMVRAVEVLELIATDDAKELLQQLAKGFVAHRLTREAQGSLTRLQERRAVPSSKAAAAPNQDDEPLPFGVSARLGTTRFRLRGIGGGQGKPAFSSDGRILAAVGVKCVFLWEAQTGKLHRKLDYSAKCLAMSPQETILAVGLAASKDKDSAIILWNWRQEKEIDRIPLPSGISPQQLGFSAEGTRLLAKYSDGSLRTLEIASRKESTLWKPVNANDRVELLGYSSDGNQIVVGGQRSESNTILNLQTGANLLLQGSGRYPYLPVFTADGKYLAAGSPPYGLQVWEANTGKLWRAVKNGNEYVSQHLAFTPDGKILAAPVHDKGIFLWDAHSGKGLKSLPNSEGFGLVGAVSPDSRWLAGMTGNSLRIWNLETGEQVKDGVGHVREIQCLAISPTLDFIATGALDGSVQMWDPKTGKQQQVMKGDTPGFVSALAFSPDGKWLASSDLLEDSSVRLWEVATGRQFLKLPGHGTTGGSRQLRFSANGRYLLSWGDDFYLRKWDLRTGRVVLEHRTRPAGSTFPEDDEDEFLSESAFSTFRLAIDVNGVFSPGADQFLLFSRLGFVQIFDVATGKETRKLQTTARSINSVAVSPTGKHGVLFGPSSPGSVSTTVFELPSGKAVITAVYPVGGYGRAEFSPDGRTVATSYANNIAIVEIASGKTRLAVENLAADTRSLAFSSDGRSIVTAMDDTTALVWDLAVLAGRKQQ